MNVSFFICVCQERIKNMRILRSCISILLGALCTPACGRLGAWFSDLMSLGSCDQYLGMCPHKRRSKFDILFFSSQGSIVLLNQYRAQLAYSVTRSARERDNSSLQRNDWVCIKVSFKEHYQALFLFFNVYIKQRIHSLVSMFSYSSL